LRAGGIDRAPGNLVRQFVDDGGRIEFRSGAMLSMPAKASGVMRYRQDRTIAFMVSSVAVS
jgi:hypothetical protein